MALDIGTSTLRAATAARDALATSARTPDERGMATVARQALFTEALLGAVKARVAELKSVAK
jgi:2-keto-3-deoxy-galactonokinase